MIFFDDITQINLPKLETGQSYIYILENYPQGNVKIGISSDIKERIKSLSGSNSGGNYIVKCAISEPTYLYTLEHLTNTHGQARGVV